MGITGHKHVIINYSSISVEQQQTCSNILAQSSKCNNPTASCTETMADMQPRQPLSTVEQVNLDVRPTQSLHQQMSFSRSNNFASHFDGATFHIHNFNVYN
ncbi:hypothetical protein DPMN_058355 [Dreissena polymorpha]|uniref:Uncharacterized protein n=1 Tax=Dreissena polymorpha TaxID=45954 RepID=A0A9D4C1L1_DREPO|nr:hypothetical protein DPMN_058355 [Dreissena polymorpha]